MKAFRYQAIEGNGAPVQGEIEAADRKSALQLLGARGLFPSVLEYRAPAGEAAVRPAITPRQRAGAIRSGGRVSGKDITAFTREMGALLSAAIPIPQALDGLGEEEENPALRAIVLKTSRFGEKRRGAFRRLGRAPEIVQQTVRQHGAGGRGGGGAAQGDDGPGRVAGA